MRALSTWCGIVLLALWMAVGLAVGLVWYVPTWVLTTIIKWDLDR